MKRYRYLIYYLITIGGFSLLMYFIIALGEKTGPGAVFNGPVSDGFMHFRSATSGNFYKPIPLLLLQIITIIIFAKITGFLFKKAGQPSVIGEIVAGILLGPSVLGIIAPGVSSFLFPESSVTALNFLSQIGLILFMFIIGMDFDIGSLGKKAPEAFLVSHASIIIPFALGMALSIYLYKDLAPGGVSFLSFSLFTGISLSITAFPVLARILQERNLMKSRVGTIAITCAAVDDITAWCILAALIALVKAGSFVSSLYTIALASVYVLIMFMIIRPFLKRLGDISTIRDGINRPVVVVFLVTLLASSYISEIIGIHALFGAFIAGVIMPPNIRFRHILIEKFEDMALILFLPLFFVISGLRTEFGLLDSLWLWEVTGIVILLAVAGKFAGTALSLRFVGENWRNSLIIGALMNTRGLMQLVVLSIGYELGVISPEIFTIMIIMALVTTLMTGPAIDLIERFYPVKPAVASDTDDSLIRILISFGNPESGKAMLRLAHKMAGQRGHITLLHLSPLYDLHKFNTDEHEKASFRPLEKEAEKLGIRFERIYKSTQDIEKEIIETANSGDFDMIIAGKAVSMYEGSLLGNIIRFVMRLTNPGMVYSSIRGREKIFSSNAIEGPTRRLLRHIKIPVGIYSGHETLRVNSILVPVYSTDDSHIIARAADTARKTGSSLVLLDYYDQTDLNPELNSVIKKALAENGINIKTVPSKEVADALSGEDNFLFSGIDAWQQFANDKRIKTLPPALIIKEQ
jgi:Kef-type K+ transport system membrane component KefB